MVICRNRLVLLIRKYNKPGELETLRSKQDEGKDPKFHTETFYEDDFS